MPQLPEWEGGGRTRACGLGPPTPEPGGGSRVPSLPAGPLPSQLVTFPGWRRPGRLVASPGPGLAGSGVPSHSEGLTEPRPPHLPFHPGWTQPGSLHAPLTPTQIRPLSLAAAPQNPGGKRWVEVEAKPGLLVLLKYFVPHSTILIPHTRSLPQRW